MSTLYAGSVMLSVGWLKLITIRSLDKGGVTGRSPVSTTRFRGLVQELQVQIEECSVPSMQ